jgi:outer membrane protein insertion porin family
MRISPWWLLLAVVVPAHARSQEQDQEGPSLLLVDAETTVSSVGFRYLSGSGVEEERLRLDIAYRGPGAFAGLQEALDWVPGISAPDKEPFIPLELQRDVARLRLRYWRAGYPDVAVDYDIGLDLEHNEVDITFVVDQGEPLLIDTLLVGLADRIGDEPRDPEQVLPEALRTEWADRSARLSNGRGARFSEEERERLEAETADWFHRRGYPWAVARMTRADTTGHAVQAHLSVAPGPRAVVSAIDFEGARQLDRPVLAREVPLEVGDWYDAGAVTGGQAQLYELDIVRRALGDVVPGQPRDTTVDIVFRINESQPRFVSGRVGWQTEAGFSGEAHWAHRNFLGGARTLTTSAALETGWAAIDPVRGRSAGLSANVRQPYLFHTNVSGTIGPFVRVRDDFRDRSILYGLETAVIYRLGSLRNVALQHEFSRLRIDDAFQLLPVQDLVQTGQRPFEPVFVKSVFTLSASLGTLDDRLNPRRGFLIEPNLGVSGPTGVSDIEFFRMAMSAMVALPLSRRMGLYFRVSGGRLFPYGESDPEGASPTRAIIGLRGVMFTAGGTSDVRGWGSGLLGPKIPDVEIGDGGIVGADRYVPVGGLARIIGGVELALPFPFLSPAHRTFLFLDSGRVWTPGPLFQPEDAELAVEPWGHAVGGGIQLATLVGPLRLAVGYKLNPTRVDLLSPADVAVTLAGGGSLSELETESIRRWHLHLAIGRGL